MTTPQHVCFYSNKCRWSEAFIKSIASTPFKNEVKFICVDPGPNGQRPSLPSWLKKVPTLVVRGEDEPRTDGNVMNWLAERKLLSKPSGAAAAAAATEPEPWLGNEMGGSYTKGFSFIDDNNDTLRGNFEFLNGQNAPGTRTGSELPAGGLGARQQKSKKEQMFDSQMEEYMKQRTMVMPQAQMRQ
jgi:hypothetical protein